MMYTQEITLLDGAMGTMLQRAGLRLGDRPETLSITAPDVVEGIQRQYVEAGSQMLLANTFCANAHKLAGTGFAVEDVMRASVAVARRACAGTGAKVALDVGPIGELLEPLGTLRFEEAYALFAQMIRAGVQAGADAVFFETFSDLNELRAGVLAAKECCALPVFASMTFEQTGRTFLGVSAPCAAMSLSALGVQAVGVNCSLGPKEVAPILRAMREVMAAGFPHVNMDLIAGLPTDTFESFAASLDAVCGLSPENITVHSLSLKRAASLFRSGAENNAGTAEKMIDYAHQRLAECGYIPYYLYRQKNTADNQENTGYAKLGCESLYNTYIMEELQTILAVGAGASTKLVDRKTGRIKRITNHKYPYEYLDRFDDILENKREIFSFFV